MIDDDVYVGREEGTSWRMSVRVMKGGSAAFDLFVGPTSGGDTPQAGLAPMPDHITGCANVIDPFL